VPAGLVHVPYDFSIEAERLGPSTSTGMACHPSLTVAMLTGLFEVCERDAFAIAWLNRLSLPRLRFSARSRFGAELERIVAGGGRVEFVDLTNDLGVPVVLAKLERMLLGRPLVTVGLAARTTRTEAARKALMEAASEYRRLHDELTSPAATVWQPAERFANVSDFPWHSRVYVEPAMQPRLAFLTASPREEIVDDEEAPAASANVTLAASACRLADRGVDVLAVHLTTRDVAELGLHVVKIMAPQAVPLNPHHLAPWLGHRRIYTVPVALGHREREPTVDELNLADPHPFA
jgi:ribosomal protein S12 methylthiotransferase accessory factor